MIKKGRPQKGWAKEYSCTGYGNKEGGCKALLLVEHSDLFKTHSYHYDGSHEVYITFKCSECGVLTDIKDYNGPSGIREKEEEILESNLQK